MRVEAPRPDPEAVKAASEIAVELMKKGASAVVLFGSYVRGDAYAESDVDVVAVGEGARYRLRRHSGYLASISWRTAEQLQKDFRKPGEVGGLIPGWRNALILEDPEGVASSLQKEALDWGWKALGDEIDSWVAEELTGYVEEVHKLVGNLHLNRNMAAAIQRSVIALRMAVIMAVHHRILYDTENYLWDIISEKMGDRWAAVQSRALGLGGESLVEACEASLELFSMAAAEVRHLLNARQSDVVSHACALAGRPWSEG